ncbi:hypothetical protein GCM10010191_35870 [Actinomadura vinacea]|uniref:Hint domain-containing protein n=1 Tax=Actinomadura vinacea TaxID=115336 RepID=A0ABP5W6P0_9ACTN
MLRRLGDRGEGSLSYLAVILLFGSIVAAVTAVALPDEVVADIRAGICTVAGGRDCGGRERTDAAPSPSGSPGVSPGPSGTPGGSPTDAETPEEREYREALAALAQAERDAQGVENEWDDFDLLVEIGKLGLDFIAGDIIACVENPNLGDCLWALVGLVPWGKIGKLLKSIPKVVKLIDRFLDLKRRLDKARKGRKDARDRLDRALEACQRKQRNSFVPGTPVLMADGTRRPIEHVRVGDLVWAADPRSGRGGPQPVTAVIGGTGIKRLVDITIDLDGQVGGRTTTLTGTGDHPFWVRAAGDWIDADELVFGDRLTTADGRHATVVATQERARFQRVHNLTVAGPHTFHVVAADRGVLVHNDPVPTPGESCDVDQPTPSPTPTPTPTPSKGQPDPASQAGNVDMVADRIAAHANQRSIPGVRDDDVAEYLENIMRGSPGIKMRPTPSGTPRWAWWDGRTGTMLIREGDNGTFMQPGRGYQYFLEQINE